MRELILQLRELMDELDLVVKCAGDGTATEADIVATEDAMDAVLSEMGMSFSEAIDYMEYQETEDRISFEAAHGPEL